MLERKNNRWETSEKIRPFFKISLSVSELQKGYVNYLLNSGNFKDADKWGEMWNNGAFSIANNNLKYSVIDWLSADGLITEEISPNINWVDGEEYTFSVKISANYARNIVIGFINKAGTRLFYSKTFSVSITTGTPGAEYCPACVNRVTVTTCQMLFSNINAAYQNNT